MNFNIKYNDKDNNIYIHCKSEINVSIHLYKWETTFDTIESIYDYYDNNFHNNTFWYDIKEKISELNGIKVEIKLEDKIIQEEYIRFRSRYGNIIKKQALYILSDTGIGDTLTCTPTIKKMYEIYNQKITILTYMPQLFINSPYIEKVLKIDSDDDKLLDNTYETHKIFDDSKLIYTQIDHRQISAINLGFILSEDELKMEFFPDPYLKIPELPEKFVCINPSITYTDRTWDIDKWQSLIEMIEKHIPVVLIGKTVKYDKNLDKTNHTLKIKNGIDLSNNIHQNSLSQAYHIINKSETLVTMNNGLYILALCTDSHITQLGTPWKTDYFRKRNGIQNFNLDYVIGNCQIHCTSDIKLSVNEYEKHTRPVHVHHNLPITELEHYSDRWWYKKQCYLNKPTYECHPTTKQVYESILKTINT